MVTISQNEHSTKSLTWGSNFIEGDHSREIGASTPEPGRVFFDMIPRNNGRIFIDKNFALNGYSNFPGVYAVCVMNCMNRDDNGKFTLLSEHILYIGSSKNIGKRVLNPNHPYRIVYERLSNYDSPVYIKSYITDDYIQLEKELIQLVKTPLNKVRYASA